MYSLLDQNNSVDDLYFKVDYPQSSNDAPLKYAGGAVVEDGEKKKNKPSNWSSSSVRISHTPKKVCNKKKKVNHVIENYVILALAFIMLTTLAVTPPSKL
jgi:hypothetical protein